MKLDGDWAITAASRNLALAQRAGDAGSKPEARLSPGGDTHRAGVVGPWMVAEADAIEARIMETPGRKADVELLVRVGLTVLAPEVHCVPHDDPDADIVIQPRFLRAGLGFYPVTLLYNKAYCYFETATTRFYVGLMKRTQDGFTLITPRPAPRKKQTAKELGA